MNIVTVSPLQTKRVGALLAKEVLRTKGSESIVIGLKGDLGAGKTTFIQGFAEGLGLKRKVVSPTFVIFRHYPLRRKSRAHFFHMDAYRIKKLSELKHLNFEEMVSFPKGVVLIEWPEKIKKALPKRTRWLEFRHGRKENERTITFKS